MYRTIDAEIWIDPKVRALPPESKLLWVYLITNHHSHLSGLYHIPIPYIVHETGIPLKSLEGSLKALKELGMVKYDDQYELVWVVKMLRRQKGVNPENVNVMKSIVNQLDTFKESTIIQCFLNEYKDLAIPFEAPSKPLERGQAPVPVTNPVSSPDPGGLLRGESEPPTSESKRFIKPTLQEVFDHILEKGYTFDASTFWHHYESNGWKIGGRAPMKSWKSACVTWQGRQDKPKDGQRERVHQDYVWKSEYPENQ